MYEIVIGRSEADRKKHGLDGTVLIGKHYVKMGQTTSLSNKIYMDIARSHVVFVVGKRGSGKCVTGDTLITLDNGLEMPISELENNKSNIFGLNSDLKIRSLKKSEFYKRQVNEVIKLKLRSGREIKLTPEHPLLTVRGWIEAQNLTLASRIAVPRKIECKGKEVLKDNEIKILAYLIAEGHTKKTILFSNKDPLIVNDFKESINEFDDQLLVFKFSKSCYKISSRNSSKRKVLGYKAFRDTKGRFKSGTKIFHEKTKIRSFLEEHKIYGKYAIEKSIPEKVFQLNNKKLALFLNRLFSCDGSIFKTNNYWAISYSSSSEPLIKQVQSLLLRFGILSKIRKKLIKFNNKEFKNYELEINSDNIQKFIDQIGFFGKKNNKQEIALKQIKNKVINPNIDTIPKEIWDLYRPKSWVEVGKRLNYKSPKAARSSINYSPSRQKLLQVALADQSPKIESLAKSDIFWDEIVEIKRLAGKFTVYDLSVPEFHNFVANNIIIHNSYSMGVLAEGVADMPEEIRKNISIIMLDTMGIYWTMKYPNKKDKELLDDWGIEGKGLNVQIFTPSGFFKQYKESGIPTDFPFSIKTSDLESSDWCMTFGIDINSPYGVLIERIIEDLKESGEDFNMDDIINKIKADEHSDDKEKNALENRFLAAKKWGLFEKEGTKLKELVMPGQVTILDVSCYATMSGGANLRALVIGLVSQRLFVERMVARKKEEHDALEKEMHFFSREDDDDTKDKEPLVWLVIDEAHEFLPNEGETPASQPLITILREGRQPGISLILASQQPGKIHTDVMTQSDIVLAHRLTANIDITALGALMQSYMRAGLDKELNVLPKVKGAAIAFDDTNERMYPMRVRPRITWHGGESPSAILKKKKVFSF